GLADLDSRGAHGEAVPGEGLVADEGAANDTGPGPELPVEDGAALAEGRVPDTAVRLVANEDAVGDVEDGGARDVADGPAPCVLPAADGNVRREDGVVDRHGTAEVLNAAARARVVRRPAGTAVGDGQAGDPDGEARVDVEDPVAVVATDGELVR